QKSALPTTIASDTSSDRWRCIRVAQALAKSLSESDNAEVIVLEAIFFFYQAVGAPRAYVDGDYTNKMFIPYDNAIPKHA
ncbi:hypothetical protein JG687_00017478, partial [Phytophthora cactorum]